MRRVEVDPAQVGIGVRKLEHVDRRPLARFTRSPFPLDDHPRIRHGTQALRDDVDPPGLVLLPLEPHPVGLTTTGKDPGELHRQGDLHQTGLRSGHHRMGRQLEQHGIGDLVREGPAPQEGVPGHRRSDRSPNPLHHGLAIGLRGHEVHLDALQVGSTTPRSGNALATRKVPSPEDDPIGGAGLEDDRQGPLDLGRSRHLHPVEDVVPTAVGHVMHRHHHGSVRGPHEAQDTPTRHPEGPTRRIRQLQDRFEPRIDPTGLGPDRVGAPRKGLHPVPRRLVGREAAVHHRPNRQALGRGDGRVRARRHLLGTRADTESPGVAHTEPPEGAEVDDTRREIGRQGDAEDLGVGGGHLRPDARVRKPQSGQVIKVRPRHGDEHLRTPLSSGRKDRVQTRHRQMLGDRRNRAQNQPEDHPETPTRLRPDRTSSVGGTGLGLEGLAGHGGNATGEPNPEKSPQPELFPERALQRRGWTPTDSRPRLDADPPGSLHGKTIRSGPALPRHEPKLPKIQHRGAHRRSRTDPQPVTARLQVQVSDPTLLIGLPGPGRRQRYLHRLGLHLHHKHPRPHTARTRPIPRQIVGQVGRSRDPHRPHRDIGLALPTPEIPMTGLKDGGGLGFRTGTEGPAGQFKRR